MDVKEVLLVQLRACLENTWFVSLENTLADLSEEQANWKPNETTNSIFELVNHLIFYNHRYLNWFNDIPNEKIDNPNSFFNREGLSWQEAVRRSNNIMSDWKTAIEEAEVSKLEEKYLEMIDLINHAIYHTGQILYIRKLQGSWNPEMGVKG